MKLRFKINQAQCLRNGIDAPKSIVTIEVEPAELSQEQRTLIADRLDGIDVHQLLTTRDGTPIPSERKIWSNAVGYPERIPLIRFIEAKAPTFEALMSAIEADEAYARPIQLAMRRNFLKAGRLDKKEFPKRQKKLRRDVLAMGLEFLEKR